MTVFLSNATWDLLLADGSRSNLKIFIFKTFYKGSVYSKKFLVLINKIIMVKRVNRNFIVQNYSNKRMSQNKKPHLS